MHSIDLASYVHTIRSFLARTVRQAAVVAVVFGPAALLIFLPQTLVGVTTPQSIPPNDQTAGSSTGQFRDSVTIFGDTIRTAPGTGGRGTAGRGTGPLDSLKVDSLAYRDSIALAERKRFEDTTYVVYLDSTARLKYFSDFRVDEPQVRLFPRRTYPLFAGARQSGIRSEMEFDSTGSTVLFRERVSGSDIRIPVSIPFDDYVALRLEYERRKLFADEARKPLNYKARDDLGDLLSTFTQIQIPVPPNPIFSIFGKPEIKLNISGAVDIKAGFRNTKSDQTTISILDQSRSEPDFSQEVQVNVNGTVGDKLNILADWNTRRTFEYENQLKIKYTGYEDEIVQSVEAGNVSLQTPSSFIGSSQALFGVKAKFQAGPLTLTTLASQKKGQIKEVSVTGGSQQIPFEIPVYGYATNHYFVDTSYISKYEPYYLNEPPTVDPDAQIVEEEVWISRTGISNDPTKERLGIAYINLPPRPSGGYSESLRNAIDSSGSIESGRFVRLDPSEYELAGDGYTGVLSLNTSVQDAQIVAIAYRTAAVNAPQYGEFTRDNGDTTLILKMVKPKDLSPRYAIAWRLMLKNIYPIGPRNIKQEGFVVDVKRRVNAGEEINTVLGRNLLNVLGLDRFNADNTPAPDGDTHFDFRQNRTINQQRGEIIFPYLRPFDDGMRQYFANVSPPFTVGDSLLYPEVYDSSRTRAQQSINNKYTLKGTATGDATSKFSIGFNVVEGSVQVLLNGQPLTPNLDYTVDYIIGEVVIRNSAALVPGANVQIKYEQNDLFQLASKTLLGARGDLAFSQRTNLGFTIMNLNQQSLSDKVRLGERPNKNTIFGVDGSTSIDLPFLTKGLDALPLLQTRELSTLRVSGEAAYMLPDPNTRKSTIPSDGGEGIAYIDDFEGSRRSIPVGVNFTAWSQSSVPVDSVANATIGTNDSTKMAHKGKMIWFNRLPTDVRITDVYPQKRVGNVSNDQITVMDVRYFPSLRGQFNYSVPLANTVSPDPNVSRNWGGVMKPISISATNLILENVNFIELWMQVSPSSLGQTMLIDLGSISEDVIPNRRLNTEDLVRPGVTIPDQVLQEGEDVGLDMLTDDQERARYPDLVAAGISDPSGDNYSFRNNDPNEDYQHINGTEGNRNGPGGLTPDTEDLNFNGSVDLKNEYFHYELALDTNRVTNPRVVGGGNIPVGQRTGWYQYRIPIREFTSRVGTPDLERIEFIRMYFQNATAETVAVRIADFSLVGNQWEELRKDDSTFSVSVVSVEETPGYTSPPGVIRERDKTRPDEEVLANEQSLSLNLNGLPDGESRQAVKFYTFRPLDVFNYRTMKMFVHGDESFDYIDPSNFDAEMFFRFGADSLNYYEYRAPVRRGWDPSNEVVINFDQLTAIKQSRDSINVISPPIPVQGGPEGAAYRVLGNPSLTQIRYLSLGVSNPAGIGIPGKPLVGTVWFNELRVTSVNDDPGVAYRFDTQLKLADLGTVAFSYSKTDPNFHTLEQRFGSRQTGTNWGINASASLERFFPSDWLGTALPITYTHQETFVKPKYLPNSDVLVDRAASQLAERIIAEGGSETDAQNAAGGLIAESETRRVTDTYAAPNFKIALPSQEWYIRDTFNRLTFGFTYTRSTERSPAIVNRTAWSWNASIRYALTLPPDYFITPVKDLFDGIWLLDEYKGVRLYFPITSFSWGVSAVRSRDVSLQRAQGAQQFITRNFTASRQLGFQWRLAEGGLLSPSGDYNLSIESSLLDLELDQFKQQRPFSKILDDIFFGDKLVNFGRDTRYSQRWTLNTKPNIPNIFNIKKYLDLSFQYSVDYNWQNSLQNGDIGKSAGFNNSINFTTSLRLKSLFDPLFEDNAAAPAALPGGRGRRGGVVPGTETPQDTTSVPDSVASKGPSGLAKALGQLKNIAKLLIKTPLLDYENININFTQTNQATNSGVVGRTGFGNFWAVPFVMDQRPFRGPSRLYQLGLISDPHGELTNFGFRSKFPFFGWDVQPGIRAASYRDANGNLVAANLTNVYRQTNRLSFKTTRALWEGARLDLSWNIGWSYNRTQTITTDEQGTPRILNTTTTGSIDRSFLTFPDVLFLGVAKSGLKEVSKRFAELKNDTGSPKSEEEKLTQAFEEGFEAFPFLRKLFGQYYPRVNWSLRWDGLEKLSMFSGFVSRLSLDHSYNSNYTRNFRNLPGGQGEKTDGQRVTYGFSPLVGLNFTFKELFKGNFGANLRYNTTTSFDLSTGARSISQTVTQELSVTASYGRRGFEIPLFGLSLNNDIDVSMSYSVSSNSRTTYDVTKLDVDTEGEPLDGSTRTVLEPRIKYVLSTRVTASVYYRYTSIKPDATGSRIPGSTTNEAGLDLHIAIQ